jgi:hypothetical protein
MVTATVKNQVENLIAMVQLLERVDANPALIGAAQYQSLTRLVQSLLSDELPADVLRTVLRQSPASAVLYENLHYDRSGLSQSPLDRAVDTEMQAAALIERQRLGRRDTPT